MDQRPWPDLLQPDDAYIFGLLQTDGSHEAGPGRKGKIKLELSSRDQDVLAAIHARCPVKSSLSSRTRATNFSASHESAIWRLCDLATREHLLGLGLPIGKKSSTAAPPPVEFSVRDYARGLTDGDGSLGFTARGLPFVSFVSASAALTEFYCDVICQAAGVVRNPGRNKRDGVFNVMVTNDAAVALASWLYGPDDLALRRKAEAARLVAAWVRPEHWGPRVLRTRWVPQDDLIVLWYPPEEAAERLGRTLASVKMRLWRLQNAELSGASSPSHT
jgi:hypothetical protein